MATFYGESTYEEYDSEVESAEEKKEGLPFTSTLSVAVAITNDQLSSFLLLHAEERNKEGVVLRKVAERGDTKVMEVLLQRGWDINNSLAIHTAAIEGKEEMVEYLIKRRANVREIDISKQQPLHLASREVTWKLCNYCWVVELSLMTKIAI